MVCIRKPMFFMKTQKYIGKTKTNKKKIRRSWGRVPASQPGRCQPARQAARQPASQPANQPASQPDSQPVSQPANQPASQPGRQPAFPRVACFGLTNKNQKKIAN